MMTSARVSVLLGLCAALVQRAAAQGTNATCLPGFEWMFNSRDQSPCLITAYLNSACISDPSDAYVYALPPNYHYRPPTQQYATPCQCSTVFYSMIGACAACQDRENLPWTTWESNCTTVYDKVYPRTIPVGTSVPAWAYLDVSAGDAFNVTAAQALANQSPPESSAGGPASTATSTGASASSSATGAPSTSSSKKSNVGPIVGGVIGGVGGFIILVGLGVWWWIRHKNAKRNAVPTDAAAVPFVPGTNGNGVPGSPYVDEKQFAPVTPQAPLHTPVPTMPVPYNPDDPRTWPTHAQSPAMSVTPTAYSGTAYPQPSATPYPQQQQPTYPHQPGGYSGVPEI